MLRIGKIISHVTVTGLDGPAGPPIQKKSVVAPAQSDGYERQALNVERSILTSGLDSAGGNLGAQIQRRARGRAVSPVTGHTGGPSVMMKGRLGGGGAADTSGIRSLMTSSSSQAIPTQARSQMEGYFGSNFSDVRLHTDSAARQAADSIGAKAFTFGNDIFLGSQAPSLTSPEGGALLGHELTHVMQFRNEATGAIPHTHDGALDNRLEQAASDVEQNILTTLREGRAGGGTGVSVERTSVTFSNENTLSARDRSRADRIAHQAVRRAEQLLEKSGQVTPGRYDGTVSVTADVDLTLSDEEATERLAEQIAVGLAKESEGGAGTTATPTGPMAASIDEAVEPVAYQKKYFLFGEELPDNPKPLEVLLWERMQEETDQSGGHWIQTAMQELTQEATQQGMAPATFIARRQQVNSAIEQWIYDQGEEPQDHPVNSSAVGDAYKKLVKKARREIKNVHRAASSPSDFIQNLQQRMMTLAGTGEDKDRRVAGLISLYLEAMKEAGRYHVCSDDETLGAVDELYRAARLYLERVPYEPVKIELPAGVPPLEEITQRHLKHARGEQAEEAQALARGVVQSARNRSSVTDQYHHVQTMAIDFLRAGNAVQVLAGQILQRYLRSQKERWARDYIEDVLSHPEQQPEPSWSLIDDVGRPDGTPLKGGHRQWGRIQEAWNRIRRIASTEVLEKIGPVKVRVHKDPFYRAKYKGGSAKEIHIAPFESVKIIMHEFGHHIEDQGGLDAWANAQRMLHGRHEQSGRLKRLSGGFDELGYHADMPVTGGYSARYYAHGSTEIVSMGMEFFSSPKKATQLFLDDPEMFMVALKAARG